MNRVVALLHALPVIVSCAVPVYALAQSFDVEGEWSLEAWRNVLSDMGLWSIMLQNSSTALGIALACVLVVGTILALLVFKTNVFGSGLAVWLLILAAAIPIHVTGASLVAPSTVRIPSRSAIELGFAQALAHLPIFVLLVGVALRGVPRSSEAAAIAGGAGPLRTILRVTIPAARSGFIVATLLVALWVSSEFSIADFLIVRTFAEEIFVQFASYGRIAEPAVVGFVQVAVFGTLIMLAREHLFATNATRRTEAVSTRFDLGKARVPVSIITLGACAALPGFPIARLFASLPDDRGVAYYAKTFDRELWVSIPTSLIAALVCAAFAVGIGWTLLRSRGARPWIVAWLTLLLATPAPILGIGFIRLANPLIGAAYNSQAMFVLAHTIHFLPIAVLCVLPALRRIPENVDRAARISGARGETIGRVIVHPIALRGTALAFVVVAILALGDLSMTVLVAPPGLSTVAQRFASLIHYGLVGEAAGLCLLTLAALAVPALALAALLRRRIGT